LSVLWTGAPDCPVCHRTVSGAPGPYRVEPATLEKTQARSAIIHRTVQCTSGQRLSSMQRSTLTGAIVSNSAAQKSEQRVRGASDCPVPQEDKAPTVARAPNPNGWVTWRRTRQCTVPVRCTHRQQPPQQLLWWLRAINTPQPPQLQASKISEHHIEYKSSSIHS
jgi:hypothetical protein